MIGVAPVGSTGLRSVTAQVSEPRLTTPAPAPAADELRTEPMRLRAEAVVFPRQGGRTDSRPDDLRRARATQRYSDDGDPRGAADQAPPTSSRRG